LQLPERDAAPTGRGITSSTSGEGKTVLRRPLVNLNLVTTNAAGMLQHPNIVSLFDAAWRTTCSTRHGVVDGSTVLPFGNRRPRPPVERVLDIISVRQRAGHTRTRAASCTAT